MSAELEQFAATIDKAILAFKADLLETAFANMDKFGIVNTSRLRSATLVNTDPLADDYVGGLDFITLKYGIKLESTKPFVVKAKTEDIIEWIRQVGLANFKGIQDSNGKYQASSKFPTEEAAIRRLAWGIKRQGLSRKSGADSIIGNKSNKRRADPWLHLMFYGKLKDFTANLATQIPESLAKDVSRAMSRQFIQR